MQALDQVMAYRIAGKNWQALNFSQNTMFLILADFKFGDSVHVYTCMWGLILAV